MFHRSSCRTFRRKVDESFPCYDTRSLSIYSLTDTLWACMILSLIFITVYIRFRPLSEDSRTPVQTGSKQSFQGFGKQKQYQYHLLRVNPRWSLCLRFWAKRSRQMLLIRAYAKALSARCRLRRQPLQLIRGSTMLSIDDSRCFLESTFPSTFAMPAGIRLLGLPCLLERGQFDDFEVSLQLGFKFVFR